MFGSFNFNEVIICCERDKHWITEQRWCNIFVFYEAPENKTNWSISLEWETCLIKRAQEDTGMKGKISEVGQLMWHTCWSLCKM